MTRCPPPGQAYPRLDVGRTALRLVLGAVIVGAGLWLLGWLIVRFATPSALTRREDALSEYLSGQRTSALNGLTGYVSTAASTVPIVGALIVLVLVTRLWLGRWREPIALVVCVAGEVTMFLAVAALVDRRRPTDVSHLDPAPPTSSYPSGHTAAAVALYGCMAVIVLLQLRPRWVARLVAALLILFPVLVGISRMYRGMHHLTDVVLGAAGIAVWVWIVVTTLLLYPSTRHEPAADRAMAGSRTQQPGSLPRPGSP